MPVTLAHAHSLLVSVATATGARQRARGNNEARALSVLSDPGNMLRKRPTVACSYLAWSLALELSFV